jgi:hypothetical protein
MRIKGSELKRIIKEEISRSMTSSRRRTLSEEVTEYNVDAGEFPWPMPKPWWANSAVANGSWDKDANIIYDLVEKHEELVDQFQDDVGEYMRMGTVTTGEPEVERRGFLGLGRKRREAAAAPPDDMPDLPASIQFFRDLTNASQLRYGSQRLFANIADRWFIISELKRFEDPRYQEFYATWNTDVDFLVDVSDPLGGMARKGMIRAACSGYTAEQTEMIEDYNQFVLDMGNQDITGRRGYRFSPERVVGNIPSEMTAIQVGGERVENYIWTMPGDDEYQYKVIDGKWHAKLRGSKGAYKDISSYASTVAKLNAALEDGTLEGNPLTSSEEESMMMEMLRRRKLRR